MAIDPTVGNALLQSQLAMHAVNDPARIAALAASLGAIPPPIPAPPIQVAAADNSVQMPTATSAPASAAPPTSAQATAAPPPPAPPAGVTPPPVTTAPIAASPAAPASAPANGGVTPADYTPDSGAILGPLAGSPELAPTPAPDNTGEQLANLGKALGAVAPPSSPAQPPAVHASPPQQGSYNPAVVADFMAALMGAQGGSKGGGISPVASLGSLIGGR